MAPFLWRGFNCLKAIKALKWDSLLFTTKFLGIPGTHLINLAGWKTKLTLESPSSFEPGTSGLGIQHHNHWAIALSTIHFSSLFSKDAVFQLFLACWTPWISAYLNRSRDVWRHVRATTWFLQPRLCYLAVNEKRIKPNILHNLRCGQTAILKTPSGNFVSSANFVFSEATLTDVKFGDCLPWSWN